MKKGFYSKLAWTGIRKNKKLYTPYILTCTGMVMMFYIVAFLTNSDVFRSLPGGDTMQGILSLGYSVTGIFSLIFLFYTNSFLVRRRKKEFGLYNILGMGKRNLAVVMFWESLIIALISLAAGLLTGIALSKFAELGMVNILEAEAAFTFTVEPIAVLQTLGLFAVIFVLILLNTLRQIHLSKPIELLHSENTGEKPPRANWFLALAGAVVLAAAYYLAVSIENPLEAMAWFFVAAVMVIIATYLLFVAGSVAICRILQRKKGYYYKTNHFVSVSSMVYRMKRNGAGLASICILCTMVLVMVSSTVCLYIGAEDSLRARYPRNINMDVLTSQPAGLDAEIVAQVKDVSSQAVSDQGLTTENILDYRVAAFAGYVQGDRVLVDSAQINSASLSDISVMYQVFVVPLEDYNRLMGQKETLEPGEAILYLTKMEEYTQDTITIGNMEPFRVKKTVSEFADNGIDSMQIIPSLYLFVPDFDETVASLMEITDEKGDPVAELHWFYGFDLDCDDDTQILVQNQIESGLGQLEVSDQAELTVGCEGVAKERASFYGLYGGLFFLGILLGVVFLFAAVLIMYYKQVSEGYEDQSRFEIMQKVGMTKKEIRKSINSQILTVFFLPLITAGVHLTFAFPLINKLMVLFGLTNFHLLIAVTVCCYLIFALFYVLVYRITSRSYYAIVSGTREGER